MKLLRALHKVFARQTDGGGRTRAGTGCPAPSRWWAVALGLGCWSAAERNHISACLACLRLQSEYQTF
jgi:hypothetical protein